MNSWYTVKVKYTKQFEDGRLKRVSEPYLIDAVSFTDAEARIYEELGELIRGEFLIVGITKTDFADIFHYDDIEDWYKCKITYVSVDADSEKEKKITNNFLVSAHTVKEAYTRLEESLEGMMVSYEIPSIMLSPIVDIFPFDGEREEVVGEEVEKEVATTVVNNSTEETEKEVEETEETEETEGVSEDNEEAKEENNNESELEDDFSEEDE